MKYVYILQSKKDPSKFYTGCTDDPKRRLAEHNSGKAIHTKKYRPWKMRTYIRFSDDVKAANFEAYLKSGSGRAFAKKRL